MLRSNSRVVYALLASIGVIIATLVTSRMGHAASKLQAAKESNARVGSLAGRQAIVFGGTAGIGQGLAERLASAGANVVIVGRNADAAQRILTTMRESNPAGVYSFIRSDLLLLANCRKAVEEFNATASRLDFVVMTQTKATTQGLTKTEEGLDEKLELHFFSRYYLGELLAPLMDRTQEEHGADVRVLTVLSAGVHSPYHHLSDDPFLESHYSLKNAADAAGFYNDLWVDGASRRHSRITWVHAAPGIVASNWGTDLPVVMRCGVRLLQHTPLAKSISECAELLLRGLVLPEYKGGFHLINEFGDSVSATTEHTDAAVQMLDEATRKTLAGVTQASSL